MLLYTWTDSLAFPELTVFPPNYWEGSQLRTLRKRAGGDPSDERTHKSPCSSPFPSCSETAEALGDILRPLIRGSIRRASTSHPSHTVLLCFRHHGYQQAQFFQGSCSIQMFSAWWIYDLEGLCHSPEAVVVCIIGLHISGSGKGAEM